MRRLNRYIGKTVFFTSLGTLTAMVGLNYVANMIGMVGETSDEFPLSSVMLVMMLRLPAMFTEFLPYGIFVGCIIGLGLHASTNEISVMRAAGVSIYRLLWSVMRPTLLLICLGLIVSQYISPVSLQLARSLENTATSGQRSLESPHGHWYRDTNRGEFLHFDRVETGGRIFGISRYGFNDVGELNYAGFAEQAIYQPQAGAWQLENYRQTNFGENRLTLETKTSEIWRTELEPRLLNILVLPPETLSITDVYQFALSRDQQNLQSHEYWLWFWRRVLQPFTVISMVLVGMSFIFGSMREATMGSRVGLAVVVGFFIWVNFSMLGRVSSILQFSPFMAVLLPSLICAAIGIKLLARR